MNGDPIDTDLVATASEIIKDVIESINEKNIDSANNQNFDLAKSIEDYAENIRSSKQVAIDCTFRLKTKEKFGNVQLVIPGIIKEYIDNVIEQYEPSNIDITLIQRFGKLELMIVDDGVKINRHLNNEEARLNTILPKIMDHNGDASLESEDDKSYLLQVSLPINS